ncbi:MAG TPA: SDR family oxidoreductase [Acidobacteriaceae bacterium]|nr:SDR family oxidoreductase [Acidobacteriaceae bacterium]
MKIIVFGASGGTGGELVRQAIAQGHSVTAFVRNPDSMPRDHEIQVIQGDVLDGAAVARAIVGHRAVLSALGPGMLKKTPLLAEAIPNILAGMRADYVTRLIVLGAAGAAEGHGRYQSALTNLGVWISKKTRLRHSFADHETQERMLAESDIDYTIIRAPRLTDGPITRKYRVLPDARPTGGVRISRADVADFMLLQLTDPRFHRQGPYIAD